jgi:predicted dehydrogenase
MSRLRLAVIGVGHLGKEHARILSGMPQVELVGVADVNLEQAQAVARRCNTQAFANYWPLLNLVDAAVIAVPTVEHHAVAGDFLRRGISLLVEKPLADNLERANELVALAEQHDAILQVGHIERFNPAFEELQRRPLRPLFIQCERLSGFTGRSTDIGAVLDLMIHDLDLVLALVQSPVQAVQALGAVLFGGHEDMVYAHVSFANGCVAIFAASRANPTAVRRMRLWGAEGYATIDFARRRLQLVQPSEEVRRHGLDPRRLDPGRRALLKDALFGRYLHTLELDCNHGDQLTRELEEFVHCLQTGSRPRVPGTAGRDALALADRILDSVRRHSWTGSSAGPTGPTSLPAPLGPLFQPPAAASGAA